MGIEISEVWLGGNKPSIILVVFLLMLIIFLLKRIKVKKVMDNNFIVDYFCGFFLLESSAETEEDTSGKESSFS